MTPDGTRRGFDGFHVSNLELMLSHQFLAAAGKVTAVKSVQGERRESQHLGRIELVHTTSIQQIYLKRPYMHVEDK